MSQALYADADAEPGGADIIIVGAPFEVTTCHRKGCSEGPAAVRRESYNFETYIPGIDFDTDALHICDLGDMAAGTFGDLARLAGERAAIIRSTGAFPILLGGEHSVTPVWLAALLGLDPWGLTGKQGAGPEAGAESPGTETPWSAGGDNICVVVVDAHMDWRDGYEGHHLSHASASRRVADLLGPAGVVPFGIRSYSSEEKRSVEELGLTFVTSDRVREVGAVGALAEALAEVPFERREHIYLSVDIDGIDPAYAPGVGTPEPFGLTPQNVKDIIRELGPGLVGFDIVEVCPPFDNGNTAALAARLVSEVMALAGKVRSEG